MTESQRPIDLEATRQADAQSQENLRRHPGMMYEDRQGALLEHLDTLERKRGRPKTKDYETMLARIPLDLAEQVKRYSDLHGYNISELIREGLQWRVTQPPARRIVYLTPQENTRNTDILGQTFRHADDLIPDFIDDDIPPAQQAPEPLEKGRKPLPTHTPLAPFLHENSATYPGTTSARILDPDPTAASPAKPQAYPRQKKCGKGHGTFLAQNARSECRECANMRQCQYRARQAALQAPGPEAL